MYLKKALFQSYVIVSLKEVESKKTIGLSFLCGNVKKITRRNNPTNDIEIRLVLKFSAPKGGLTVNGILRGKFRFESPRLLP
jgi:hypothetical protein